MADSMVFSGFVQNSPAVGSPSGFPSVNIPIDERLTLTKSSLQQLVLTVDTAVPVPFGSVVNASVVFIKTLGGHVRVRATSSDGATQSWPVDGVLVLISRGTPITALDLTRDAAVETTVEVFLGDRT